jgi:hypothetical protein
MPDQPDGTNPFRPSVVGDNSKLLFRPARLPDPTTLAPRQWLYGTQLLRGHVSVLVAPGGVGKTGYALGVAVAMASGRELFDAHIYERCNVAVLSLEEPMEELERRLAALMIRHQISRPELVDRLYLYSADDGRVTIAKLGEDGFDIIHPDTEAIIREITAHQISLLIVDPFAESHSLEENSNPQMIRATAEWRRIARSTQCAIFLIHHVRKGAATDIDAARGAKALTDSARVGLLLTGMTEEEAERFEISAEDRTSYVCLNDAKSNMARRSGVGAWFELETVSLGNCTPAYPNGDRVAAIVSWAPPTTFGDLTVVQCNRALDAIDAGPQPGSRYTRFRTSEDTSRWAGNVLIEQLSITDARAKTILAAWVKSGVIETRDYRDDGQRKDRKGLFVVDTKRPGARL